MKHATIEQLTPISDLLEEVRKIHGMKEKTQGHFYVKNRNVLHFHTDSGEIYADIGDIRILVSRGSYATILHTLSEYIAAYT